MNYQQLIAAIFALLPIYGVFTIFKMLIRKLQLHKNGIKTSATIVDFHKEEDSESIHYYPILRYKTIVGHLMEVKVEEPQPIKPKVGKEIFISYNADAPHELAIKSKWPILVAVIFIIAQLYLVFYFTYFVINNKWLF